MAEPKTELIITINIIDTLRGFAREFNTAAELLEGLNEANADNYGGTTPEPEPVPIPPPTTQAAVYPCLVGDTWVDSAGTSYDADLHGWNREKGQPSVMSTGVFRARRKKHSANETPPPPVSATPPVEPEPEEQSPTLKAMLINVKMCEDAAALNRIENHPFTLELSDLERAVLVSECRKRGAELTQGG